ncbi:MAG: TolC family protein [Acidobacteriota bacterium]|nr:TolC family protein [Acidobacteriota bacterium]
MRTKLNFVLLVLLAFGCCRGQTPFSTGANPPRRSQDNSVRRPGSTSLGMQSNPVQGSTPSGAATSDVLDLTLEEALSRALKYNLALAEGDENVREQRAQRLRALSQLLPQVNVRPSISEQQVNLAAFGFSGFPGVPSVVGPFTVYDARASLSQSFSLRDLRNHRAAQAEVTAAEFMTHDARELVTLVSTGLYLQAISGRVRLEAQQAQVATADAAYRQASDRRAAGTVPGIDVLRAQVEFQAEQQRMIYYEGEFEKQKLSLARAIGLPPGQPFRIAEGMKYERQSAGITIEATLQQAYQNRPDYRAAEALVHAAEIAKSAARAGRYPSVSLDANYGVIGPSLTSLHGTFAVAGAVDIPIFQGGRVQADVESADALLRRRRAELEDLRGRIDSEVRTSFIDILASSRQVDVAVQNVDLAKLQLVQAQDRFAAGVTNNLEVVQAQQAVALANENSIAALYTFNVAKASLARARGDAEQSITDFIRRVK